MDLIQKQMQGGAEKIKTTDLAFQRPTAATTTN